MPRKAHPLYATWKNLRQRCGNPKHPKYPTYGARGIAVCPEWSDFFRFVADVGQRPEGHTLDRKDNDGPYSKENCHWATPDEQARNKTSNRNYTLDGETMTRAEWSRRTGIPDTTLRFRLNNGWSPKEAFGAGN